MTQCQGHDTRKKATTDCLNCKKSLCNSCLKIHLSLFEECAEFYNITKGISKDEA